MIQPTIINTFEINETKRFTRKERLKEQKKIEDIKGNLRNLETRIYPLNELNCKIKGTKERISKLGREQ